MKYLLTALVILGFSVGVYSYVAFALDSGALSPGTMADDATVGTVAWTNPNNAKVSDNVYATSGGLDGVISHYLKATNFGFSIPAGVTVNGILVEIERKSSGGLGQVRDSEIKIVKADGSIGTTNKASGTNWSSTEAYFSYGSLSDLWGETWDDIKINDVDFGVVISIQHPAAGDEVRTANVDHARITVYYTTVTGNPQVQVRSGVMNVKSGATIIK